MFLEEELQTVTEQNVGLLTCAQQSQSTGNGLWWKKVQHLLQGANQEVQDS